MNTSTIATEMEQLKSQLKGTWMSGDYDRFSRYMERSAHEFLERLDLAPGTNLLDVACGAGQFALIAAREGANVTGVDIASNLIEKANIRARAERVRAVFREADAEALPFEDGGFDVVTSMIGAMFAPRPELVARELLRVCSPGGTIAMANWTSEGFVGRMFKIFSRFIAPPGMPSPLLWGDEKTVRERLGAGVSDLSLQRRHFMLDYPFPPADVVDFFGLYYGPTNRAFAVLDEHALHSLRRDLEKLWSSENLAEGGLTVVKAEYLEVIAVRS
jgi:SAM-dependent methyltransferase